MNNRNMRPTRLLFPVLALMFLCLVVNGGTALGASAVFFRSLSIGMTGPDVFQLQKILNSSPKTQVSQSGPGSNGLETGYFGNLTKLAVAKFQEEYASEILVPNGLKSGTGYVGPSTLKVLSRLASNSGTVSSASTSANVSIAGANGNDSQNLSARVTPAQSVTPTQSPVSRTMSSRSTIVTKNPANEIGLDTFLADIETVSARQGIPPDQVAKVKAQVIKDIVSTTTDLRQLLLRGSSRAVQSFVPPKSLFAITWSKLLQGLKSSIFPQKVQAQTGDSPFGSTMTYAYYCSCSGNWLLDVTPTAPTFVMLLIYEEGTEGYPYYNLPFAMSILGSYTPGGGQCTVIAGTSCPTVSSEGQITALTGSM